ncbi:MAG: hypothetical protein K9N23_13655 [Akkermansiaceae bacterium]|nr:hypothetical protein [Akkermansiaceae bacterium]MCF7732729.1 hypothetical protein [Akkermansiaceae bacterium]
MSTTADHTHHIKIRSTQLEMPTRQNFPAGDDYDHKLKVAEAELERIQGQKDELARKKQELEELTARKRTFLSQQSELFEKFTSAVTLINRELEEARQEAEDLEQCRACFAAHLDKIQKLNPESWNRDNLAERLERSNMIIDIAVDEYDQAAAHFEGRRCGSIFGGREATRKRAKARVSEAGEFRKNLQNGLAFNLPVCVLGGLALVIYLLK